MSSPERSAYPVGTGSSSGSTRKRVITVPTWARNLPPDDFPDDDEPFEAPQPPPTTRNRSLSTILRPPPKDVPAAAVVTKQNSRTVSTSNEKSGEKSSEGTTPKEPEKALQTGEVRRQGSGVHSDSSAADKWWTFTLPSKYLDKVQEYVQHSHAHEDGTAPSGSGTGGMMRKLSRSRSRQGMHDPEKDEEAHINGHGDGMTMGARLAPPNVFSVNQTQTPGWSSPWTPFHGTSSDPNYPNLSRNLSHPDPFNFAIPTPSKKTKFESFVLNNPFAPLFFRFFNLAFSTAALGLASHIRIVEHRFGVIGVVGVSTLMVICVTPFAMIHIFVNVYVEYFGRPIGIWQVRTKMFYTLLELVFICLYSAILSLTFNDLFTSPLECTSYTPYAAYSTPPASTGSSKIEGTVADKICNEQMALVSFTFLSVFMYTAVLVVSLFRIFNKVSRKA